MGYEQIQRKLQSHMEVIKNLDGPKNGEHGPKNGEHAPLQQNLKSLETP